MKMVMKSEYQGTGRKPKTAAVWNEISGSHGGE
jgi:hypothetical protein